jgi:hypothetical protein
MCLAGDVYYFCGSRMQYCTCTYRWNFSGWNKAITLWAYVLTTALGVQRLLVQLVLQGLLPGEHWSTPAALLYSLTTANMPAQLRRASPGVCLMLSCIYDAGIEAASELTAVCCFPALPVEHTLIRGGSGDQGEPDQHRLALDPLLAQCLGAAVGR